VVETCTWKNIKCLQININGGDYVSHEFNASYEQFGIARDITNSYTSKQNGVLEIKNRTLVESVSSMLKYVGFPNSLWGEVIATCYVQNHFPTQVVPQKNPYELWHGTKPNVKHLQIFYCYAHIHVSE
jgi:hypothetical protein